MPEAVFNVYSRYYDLLYQDKDYEGEVRYIERLLAKYGLSRCNLLEFGSGTGKHGRLLAAKGFKVHGIERSQEMVDKVISSDGFSCEQADICEISLGKTYDAILSLFHVVSYLTTNHNLCKVFERASEHLSSGGLFIFDFWYSPAVYAQHPSVRVKRMSDSKSEITRIAEPTIHSNENRVDVNYSIFARDLKSGAVEIFEERHSMRHFSVPEIQLLATAHGFEFLSAEEFMTGLEPSESTWGVCITLRREDEAKKNH